jgi:WhiB family redox-sensing transcriptional regulator
VLFEKPSGSSGLRREGYQSHSFIAFWGANVPVTNIDWRQLGACRGLDPGIFYPETDDESDSAKLVCAACGVRTACLEHALQRREKQGVWGGSTERERRRIIRQRRRSA